MLPRNKLLQNRYRIIGTLGKGGMGHVYEAIDESVSAQVAIKENLADTAEKRKSFEHEAKLLANLRHDALPRVMHHFIEEDKQFLVMEYIKGENLLELLEKYQRLSLHQRAFHYEVALKWADTLLGALEYLHGRVEPIIHRDIKPSNIKLTNEGKIYLLDFGLAKGAAGQMTTVKEPKGTPSVYGYSMHYAPLEQLTNAGTDARSDLYALGATLYHLLTGDLPITAADRHKALDEGEPDPLRPAHEVNAAVPEALSQVIAHAMALSRRDRFTSAIEMRQTLHEFQQMVKESLVTPPLAAPPDPIPVPEHDAPPEPTIPAPVLTVAGPVQSEIESSSESEAGQSPVTNSADPSTITGEPPAVALPIGYPVAMDTRRTDTDQQPSDTQAPPSALSLSQAGDEQYPDLPMQSSTVGEEQGEDPRQIKAERLVDRKAYQRDNWRDKMEQQKREMQEAAQAMRDRAVKPYQWKGNIKLEPERGHQPRGPFIILAIFVLLFIGGVIAVVVVFVSSFKSRTEKVANSNSSPTPTINSAPPIVRATTPPPPSPYFSPPRSKQILKGQKGDAWAVVASPDGNLLASASADHNVRLWDARSKQLLYTLSERQDGIQSTSHQDVVYAVAFSPDGKTLASAGKDTKIKLWDTQSGKLIKTLPDHSEAIYRVAFSPDGKQVASASIDEVRLWDWQSSPESKKLEVHSGKLYAVAFSPSGSILASAGQDKTIRLWDVQNMKELRAPLIGHTDMILSVAFSRDGRFLVSGGKDRLIKVWETEGWRERTTLDGLPKGVWVTSLAFSPDDQALASANTDGVVRLWDTQTWKAMFPLKGHSQSVTSISFPSDAKLLISGSRDKTVRLWEW